MNKNEIKKLLYKEKPIAKKTNDLIMLVPIENTLYKTILNNGLEVYFTIPPKDKIEEKEIPAQLLIRWLLDIKYD
jgi:hypothetical protein